MSMVSHAETNRLIDTPATISKLLDSLEGLPTTPPSLYIDLEGENISIHGPISILQLHVLPSNQTYLLDVKLLGHDAFTTPGTGGRTLRQLLESEHIPKVIFDVRNDSAALYKQYQVSLAGMHDLQLMELGKRNLGGKRFVNGLGKCIEYDAGLTLFEKAAWKSSKEIGFNLFAPERGGSYAVFNERPLRKEVEEYCIQDAVYLPRLWSKYNEMLTPAWKDRVLEATKARLVMSQDMTYVGNGPNRANGPDDWRWL
ncbi:hypothetical protein SLS62_006167 [Diatrype stigma]|uniref:3'-5' exonuclease domain-containing protein n=1 Tax=Diatrype stigma TaxID=117547 RepID=A0AAN9YP93_9PEZI